MQREIKFKGKAKYTKEWVYGDLIHFDGNIFIGSINIFRDIEPDDLDVKEVDPDTICQFTGLYDRDGNEVWEHDIVEKNDSKFCKRGEVQMPEGTWMVIEDETHYFNLHFYQDQIHVIGNKFETLN